MEGAIVLSLISKVSKIDNVKLIREPSNNKINDMVFGFHNEKSPDLDGITTKVLYSCWPFIRFACYQMVKTFWLDGVMPLLALVGVIKLILKMSPKDGDLS